MHPNWNPVSKVYPVVPHPLQYLVSAAFFILTVLVDMVVLILIALMTYKGGAPFHVFVHGGVFHVYRLGHPI